MKIPSMLPLLSSPLTHFFSSLSSFLRAVAHGEYFPPIKTSTSNSMSRYGHWSGTLSSQDSPCHIRGSTPDAPGHMASRRLAASCGVRTFVSNALLSVRAPAPVTQYSLRLSTPVGRPSGGDPT